jgi:hypothetical protein
MNRNRLIILLLSLVIVIALFGCTSSPPTPSEEDILTAMAETSAALPTATTSLTEEPTEPLAPTDTPTPNYTSRAFVTSSNLNLRTGPSQLFNILDTYQQGDEVFVTGRIPSGKWLQVEARRKDGSGRMFTGWMFADYLDLKTNINNLPIIELPAEQTIKGIIEDNEGNPINGIRVSAFYEPDGGVQTFSDDTTGLDGKFIIYVPENTAGEIDVQIVAVNCNSVIMDNDCVLRQYFPLIWREIGQLPFYDPINFVYEKAVTVLEGKVVYQDGWGVPNVWVIAVRQSDGTELKIFTEIGGRFLFPLGEGVWEVYAIRVHEDGKSYQSASKIYTITQETGTLEELRIPVP